MLRGLRIMSGVVFALVMYTSSGLPLPPVIQDLSYKVKDNGGKHLHERDVEDQVGWHNRFKWLRVRRNVDEEKERGKMDVPTVDIDSLFLVHDASASYEENKGSNGVGVGAVPVTKRGRVWDDVNGVEAQILFSSI